MIDRRRSSVDCKMGANTVSVTLKFLVWRTIDRSQADENIVSNILHHESIVQLSVYCVV